MSKSVPKNYPIGKQFEKALSSDWPFFVQPIDKRFSDNQRSHWLILSLPSVKAFLPKRSGNS